FEAARADLAAFINAAREEVILTKGTTEGINLVAQCLGRERLQAGDEILITALEHHANIVPWQQVCERTGATLQVTPLREDGSVDTDAFHQLLSERTRIVALSQVSNSLGSVT
ncbi:MAG TPA: cysteine desulfurase CsdA, partial [Alcanivorax sp.]|nr:cysteine desulfurase CsdA [Alcanivorax sp.]